MVGWEENKMDTVTLDGEVLWWDLFFKKRSEMLNGESGREKKENV